VLKSGDLGSIVVSSPDLEGLNEGQPLPLSGNSKVHGERRKFTQICLGS
jgi:hypothetical protein